MCSSRMTATSASVTLLYQTPSGYTTTVGPSWQGPRQSVGVTMTLPRRLRSITPKLNWFRTPMAPFSPQEPLGWPGGRVFLHTRIWYLGFGMMAPFVGSRLAAWPLVLPPVDAFLGELPVFDPGDHKVNVVVLRLELARRLGHMGRDHLLLRPLIGLVLWADINDAMTEGPRWHLVAVLVDDLEVLQRDLEDHAPDPVADRGGDAGQPAAPLGRPARKGQGMIGHTGADEVGGFRRQLAQVARMEICTV